MLEKVDTIIIGGGVSGLGCAKTLSDNGQKFKLITENIGGRIKTSKDGKVNYGAHLITVDYDNILQYVDLKDRLHMYDLGFYKGGKHYKLVSIKMLPYLGQLMRLLPILKKFRKEYAWFRKESEHRSQKELFAENEFLNKLFHMRADEFAHENNITALCHKVLCESLYSLTFVPVNQLNTFLYLHFLQPLIMPMYRYEFRKGEFIEPFKENIEIDTVVNLNKKDNGYEVVAKNKTYFAKNVVVATPFHISKKLIGIQKGGKIPVEGYVIHLKGKIRDPYNKVKAELFHAPSNMMAILKQPNDTVLVYARRADVDLDRYFSSYDIIEKVHWQPAEFMIGGDLVESDRGDNLYVIGDYNIGGLEASFITGIFAGNKIIEKL